VLLAEDGFDALAKITDHEPDLIFCDILMPRLDGYQTCALIKKSPRYRDIPVIMLSSKDGLFDRARGRMVGSDQYLTKPFTKDTLIRTVGEHLNRSVATAGAGKGASVSPAAPDAAEPAKAASQATGLTLSFAATA
jgi:twitching motility two-component system response regulator PilG